MVTDGAGLMCGAGDFPCQERDCLHFFGNSFHSPLSQTLDDINIMCLVISSASAANGVSGCASQECGLPVWLWVLTVRYLSSPLHHPKPSLALGSFAHWEFLWAGENCLGSLLWSWWLDSTSTWEHPNAFLKVGLASPSSGCLREAH